MTRLHIVPPAGFRAMPKGPRSRSKLPHFVAALRASIAIAFARFCGWLGKSFGESPRGFAFFVALLFPITVAAFCIGYFGLRELLAGVGL